MNILRDVVRVTGADAATFLQGQLSQDVEALAPSGSAWSLILQPQGKVDAWVRVTRVSADEFLLDVDAGFGGRVITRLDRFLLRVKAAVELVGEQTFAVDERASEDQPLAAVGRAVDGAVDGDWAARWNELRVRLGIPAMGAELTDDTIPEEVGLVDASVSFTKGCYTGQELVARIDSRGRNVPRRLRRIVAPQTLEVTAELVHEGKVVGRVTSAAGAVGLGFVARSVEAPAEVEVAGGVARIEPLPPLR
ncbi:MAG TPA: hypothetical protein VM345_06285 [Acidimicrobiales bacterium]|nr:hypothetical protein [Acidimicrobiales bacterium]